MKLACVVHRFGAGIAGGSEAHCLNIAERLAKQHDVTVLTTCARDHITWRNELPAGETPMSALRVLRFPVVRQRSLHRFAEISEAVLAGGASAIDQELWFRENGPDAPALLDHLERHGREYDRVLFWAYRYATSYFGLPPVADRAVLLPTAEDDRVITLDVLGRYFSLPSAFMFLTPEEQDLVARRANGPLAPATVIGSGLEPVSHHAPAHAEAIGIRKPFVLYLGRVDPNKGCETLVTHFRRYRTEGGQAAELVLAGPVNMPLPEDPDIRRLGYVDERLRHRLLEEAALLVVPSPYESLSLALLEAWNHGVCALVNGRCAVLRGQARRANGALHYGDYGEFAAGLEYLLTNPAAARQLGAQGLAYVNREYRWPHVMAKIESVLDPAARARTVCQP